jgi:hypothetical protein
MPLSSLNVHVTNSYIHACCLWRVIRPQVSRPLHIFLPGWIGLPLLLIFTLTSSYTGIIISKSWIIIQNRFPEYSQHVPDPYPVIREKAYGKFGRYVEFLHLSSTLFDYKITDEFSEVRIPRVFSFLRCMQCVASVSGLSILD